MNISLLQFDVVWHNKEANYVKVEQLFTSISETDLVVLPEMWNTGFSMDTQMLAEPLNGPSVMKMRQWANTHNALIIGSLIIKEKDQFFNRLIAAFPDGSVEYYDKRHLFTYAQENEHFSPGIEKILITYKGWKILPLVCYDLRFPIWSRFSESTDYDILIYVASWPERRISAWDKLLQARAIENQSYCLGVNRVGKDGNGINYSGHSQAISYSGEIEAFSSSKEEVIPIELQLKPLYEFRSRYPFLKDRDID